MNTMRAKRNIPPSTRLWCALAIFVCACPAACSDAVVGANVDGGGEADSAGDQQDADMMPTGSQELCRNLGKEICAKACECGGDDGCVVGANDGEVPFTYEDLAACESSFVTAACLNPPNPATYYENCLGTVDSCIETTVGEPVSAARVPTACSNPNGIGIVCGDDFCALAIGGAASDEECCVGVDGDTSTASCQPQGDACEAVNLSLGCDGPEDCGGMACCGSVVSGVACTTELECPAEIAQYCHTDFDCPAGRACLLDGSYAGFEIDVCSPP